MKKALKLLPVLAILVASSLVFSKPTYAAVLHGATIAKGCDSPKSPGDTAVCDIQVGYNDAAGDTISVDQVWDVQDVGGDNVRVPSIGNLPISAVSGNTTCTVAGSLPCFIGPSGSTANGLPGTASNGTVTFHSDTYVIQANDPDPLPDQGNAVVHDLCNVSTAGCNTLSNQIQFTSQTDLIFSSSVVTNIHNAAHNPVTSVPVGTTVHDNAVVSSNKGTPTGTVDFNLYSNDSCTGSASTQTGVALVAGVAESNTTVANAALSYKAHYNGDANHNPSDGVCEPLAVEKLTPTVTSEVHNPSHTDITNTTVDEGTVVHDKAFVGGSSAAPTGTVDFLRFTNGSCTGSPADTQSGVSLNSATNPATAESNTFVSVAGAMSYMVHYNGDGVYSAANGLCEPLTVQTVARGCTLTQGYWKNHASAWPVTSLLLGTVNYTEAQLLGILKTPVKGNGLVSLSHQLIAAKLNVANGAVDPSISTTISNADTLIGSLVVPNVGSGFLSPSTTSSLTNALDNFNSGVTGPGHCSE